MDKYNQEIIGILKKVGAFMTDGHFVGTSGRHMDTYIAKDALFPHVKDVVQVCKMFAEKNKDFDIDVVAAPALGGIILAQGTAYELSKIKNKEILAVFTEKDKDGGQIFTRGYDSYVRGKKVLILEDIVTTGGSVQKVIQKVKQAGGVIVAVSVMVNKNPEELGSSFFRVPFNSLGELSVVTYEAVDCPLCKKGVSINVKFGHGRKFIESKNESNKKI